MCRVEIRRLSWWAGPLLRISFVWNRPARLSIIGLSKKEAVLNADLPLQMLKFFVTHCEESTPGQRLHELCHWSQKSRYTLMEEGECR